ncbi:MAG TPA: DNA/RNA nuclease SfsA [Candidatus Fimicola cottocaccae]|nr:DNA/RNA nuclease SfsA [Candidatus Fimicola cottocaccae]
MVYNETVKAVFKNRPNRFIANVILNGKDETVHVKNTGRCKELLLEGATVILEKSNNPNRKTAYSLIAVYKGDNIVNMDSQAPNEIFADAISSEKIEEIGEVDFVKREVKYKNSRFDIYYEKNGKKGFVEVKGVTLEENGLAKFPDAPTERGTKHILELMEAKKEGYETSIAFVVQMKGVKSFTPHKERDKKFYDALYKAYNEGVNILLYDCNVSENSIDIDKKIYGGVIF